MEEFKPRPLKLYKALKLSYEPNENKRKKILKRFGYRLDTDLSTPERLVAYNPFNKQILYASRGTNLRSGTHVFDNKDIQTDILLGSGGLTQTKRFEEEKNTLLKARKKYNEDKVVLVGHSLGGGIINQLPQREQDKVYTYNAPILKKKSGGGQQKHLRTAGDIFSVANPAAQTLPNPNSLSANIGSYLLKAHELANLQNQPIFV
jgi:hypothetical protein